MPHPNYTHNTNQREQDGNDTLEHKALGTGGDGYASTTGTLDSSICHGALARDTAMPIYTDRPT